MTSILNDILHYKCPACGSSEKPMKVDLYAQDGYGVYLGIRREDGVRINREFYACAVCGAVRIGPTDWQAQREDV